MTDQEKEIIKALVKTSEELMDACQKAGAFDNVFCEIFPEEKTRGVRADHGYARIDRARNEMKAAISVCKSLIAQGTP